LTEGTYSIVELTEPPFYLDGTDNAGSLGGDATTTQNSILNVYVGPNQHGTDYDFGKIPNFG
jgi:hypothetical protein